MICKYCCKEFVNLQANRICRQCFNKKRNCKYNGCTYINLPSKCRKHELFYCDYNYECDFDDCDEEIISGDLIRHYHLDHDVRYYLQGLHIQIEQKPFEQLLILAADFGYVLCEFTFDDDKLKIYLYTPLANEELINYECEILIRHLGEDEWIDESKPNCQLFGKEDWFYQTNSDLIPWDDSFMLFIYISRN